MNALGYFLYFVGAIAGLAGLIFLIIPCFGFSRRDGAIAFAVSVAFVALGPQLSPKLKAEIDARNEVNAAQAKPETPNRPIARPLDRIRLSGMRWEKSGFGSVMIATFVINNDNMFAIKDVEITCVHSTKTGTVIDRNTRTVTRWFKRAAFSQLLK